LTFYLNSASRVISYNNGSFANVQAFDPPQAQGTDGKDTNNQPLSGAFSRGVFSLYGLPFTLDDEAGDVLVTAVSPSGGYVSQLAADRALAFSFFGATLVHPSISRWASTWFRARVRCDDVIVVGWLNTVKAAGPLVASGTTSGPSRRRCRRKRKQEGLNAGAAGPGSALRLAHLGQQGTALVSRTNGFCAS
jgi:hypothetical protein